MAGLPQTVSCCGWHPIARHCRGHPNARTRRNFGRQRITRHLWRMCYGLFIATGSFFLGQQQVFPAFLRGTIFLTLLALLPLPLLIYWLLRVRFSKGYMNQLSPNPVPVTP